MYQIESKIPKFNLTGLIVKEEINHILISVNSILGFVFNLDDFVYEIESSKLIEFHKHKAAVNAEPSNNWNTESIVNATVFHRFNIHIHSLIYIQ